MEEQQKNQQQEFKQDKNFFLSSWAIDNKVTVYVIIAIILIVGISAFSGLPRENFPEIIENKVYISSVYPGVPADDVEKLVTEPLEDEIRDISGLLPGGVESVSFNDFSLIIAEFNDDVNTDEAKVLVQEKVDLVKAEADWPTLDTGPKVEPTVYDLNIAEETPIANINLSGNYTPQDLKAYAEELQDIVEEIPEIKEAPVRGVNDKEVEVAVDVYKMAAAQVSFGDITNALAADNTTISGGNVTNNGIRANIRVIGEFQDPKEIENVVVKEDGGAVYLRDIADIKFKEEETTTIARADLTPIVMLDVKKRSKLNMISAMEQINEKVEMAREEIFPADLKVEITNDQAPKTQNQVDDLINNIIFGVLLVVGVLMFFLGFKNASFVGFAIPLSMLMSLIIVMLYGMTMNTMVLFAMVMGLGMLVDNGIVVVENVYTLINKGVPPKLAAKQGVGEIAWPIIASTATTIMAFIPLSLWPGVMGKFMVYFPITLSMVLGSSLIVALVINSMMTSEFMTPLKKETPEEKEISKKKNFKTLIKNSIIIAIIGLVFAIPGWIIDHSTLKTFGNILLIVAVFMYFYHYFLEPASHWFQDKFLPILESRYRKIVNGFLKGKRPTITVIGLVVMLFGTLGFFGSLMGSGKIGVLFFPETYPNQVFVYMEYPEGTDIEKTNATAKEVERRVNEVLKNYVIDKDGTPHNYMAEVAVGQVGDGSYNPQTDAGSASDIPHKAKITVSLREFKYRKDANGNIKNSKEVLSEVRQSLKGIPGLNMIVEPEPVGPPAGYPINIELQGGDYFVLMDEAEKMIDFINGTGIQGMEGLRTDVSRNNTEIQLDVNEQYAGSLGISNQMVGLTLRQSIYGWEATRYKPKNDDDDYPVNVRLKESQRNDESAIYTQPITFKNQNTGNIMQVPISALTTSKKTKQFSQIKRKDYKHTITVYSNVLKEDGYNEQAVANKVKDKLLLANYKPGNGVTYKFTGQLEESGKQMAFLMSALGLAAVGIMLIIVLQFNSISKPIIIMTAVILSFIGVFLGIIISGSEFVILMTMMGIISLAGIVVNNAIVLIDYTDLLIGREKKNRNIPDNVMIRPSLVKHLIAEGGESRLRPVLLTAITTVLGLLPLAIGLNINFFSFFESFDPDIYIGGDNVAFWGPLAWTVIYGLIFATFLTLIVVPVLQYLVHAIKFRFRYGKHSVKYPLNNNEDETITMPENLATES